MRVEAFFQMSDKPTMYVITLRAKEAEEILLGDSSIINEIVADLNEEWGKYNDEL